MIKDDVPNPKDKLKKLMEEIKTKYHGKITNVYDAVFYGFAFRVPEAGGYAINSFHYLQHDQSITVEEDQIVHTMEDPVA